MNNVYIMNSEKLYRTNRGVLVCYQPIFPQIRMFRVQECTIYCTFCVSLASFQVDQTVGLPLTEDNICKKNFF